MAQTEPPSFVFKAEPELLIDCDELCHSNNNELDDVDVTSTAKSTNSRTICNVCDRHFNHFSNLLATLMYTSKNVPRLYFALQVHKRMCVHTGVSNIVDSNNDDF